MPTRFDAVLRGIPRGQYLLRVEFTDLGEPAGPHSAVVVVR